jgi:hypothetical protein
MEVVMNVSHYMDKLLRKINDLIDEHISNLSFACGNMDFDDIWYWNHSKRLRSCQKTKRTYEQELQKA